MIQRNMLNNFIPHEFKKIISHLGILQYDLAHSVGIQPAKLSRMLAEIEQMQFYSKSKRKIRYPAAEQRGILKSIERPKGWGLVRRVYGGLVCLRQDQTLVRLLPAFYQPMAGWLAGGLNKSKKYCLSIQCLLLLDSCIIRWYQGKG